MTIESSDIRGKIEQNIRDAYDLLGTVIDNTIALDKKARAQDSKWYERHRFHVLVEAARESLRTVPDSFKEPWLVAELSGVLDVVRVWKKNPLWQKIEPSLVNPTDFSHVIATLLVAENWKANGHRVELVPTSFKATPDLRIQAIGGKQGWLQVECYQPKLLAGKPVNISVAEAFKIVKGAMKKAKFQLGSEIPGILAICTYNQPPSNLKVIRQVILTRLGQTSRIAFAGIILFSQNNLATKSEEGIDFTPIVRIEFLRNPSYFGAIEIGSESSPTFPPSNQLPLTEIKEPLVETVIRDYTLLQRQMDTIEVPQDTESTAKRSIALKVEKLLPLPTAPSDLPTITWTDAEYSVFFEGTGGIDYVCATCDTILSKKAWKLSCSNFAVQCPKCRAYNKFPQLESTSFRKTNNILLEPGRYQFSGTVFLKPAACLIGSRTIATT